VRRHNDWNTSALELAPVAPATGPFARKSFLVSSAPDAEFVESDSGLLALTVDDGVVRMAGHADVTDYHSPLGSSSDQLVCELAESLPAGTLFEFDSLPIEAQEPIVKGLTRAGVDVTAEQHAVAAVLELPDAYDGYLEAIGKKQRHEVRRKGRRYEELVGPVVFEAHTGDDWAFAEFIRLHRLSGGSKGTFMTAEHEALFHALICTEGWRIEMLRHPESERRATACLFVYTDPEGRYLYNSAYDPALSEGSPGVVMLSASIEQSIADGCRRFDFLKGDEIYKFRLGAHERPLYRVAGST
jgi:CelD/BcsL family acetyltransferase involved in cellulose biosynthesis